MIVRSLPKNRIQAALAVSLLAASGLTQAHGFCVSTAQQFQDALTQSSDGGAYNGEDNTIALVANAYLTGTSTANGPFHYHNSAATGTLSVYGGYDAGCATRQLKTGSTVLDGNHATQVLSLASAKADINLSGLTIQNGESTQAGAGLIVNPDDTQSSQVLIEENIFRNNHTTAQGGGLAVYSGGTGVLVYVEQNLIVANSADQGDAGGFIVSNAGNIHLYNNTVTGNTTPVSGGTGGIYCASGDVAHVNNNIFWNNTNYGLYLQGTQILVAYNDYDRWLGPQSSQNLSADPQFIGAASGDYRLRGTSPLLGISYFVIIAPDLDGNSPPLNGPMDIGAYQETVFTSGFDIN